MDEDGQVLAMVRRPTPGDDVAGTEDAIAESVAELADRYDVVAVGVGAAGWIANRPGHRAVLAAPGLAGRAAAGRAGRADRDAGHGGERRQRGRPGPSTGSAPPAASGWSLRHARHRDRRRAGGVRGALPRRLRGGRRVGAHGGGAGRAALRLRQPRLLGDVRQRHRAGPRRPRAGRGLAGRRAPAAGAGRRRPGRADRHGRDHRGPGGRPGGGGDLHRDGALAGPRASPTWPRCSTRAWS